MKKFLTLFVLTCLNFMAVYSQEAEPLDLAKKIFGKDTLPSIKKYITGEYKGQPNGQDIKENVTRAFLLLSQTNKKAVVAMRMTDSSGDGFDSYLHFEKDTTWKMCAFRSLAMTGIIEQAIIELEKMTPQEVDAIIKSSKKEKMFASKEDYEFELGNSKLTIESDENIIAHFLKNKKEFNRIKDLLLAKIQNSKAGQNSESGFADNFKDAYRKLFISSVSVNYVSGNGLNFSIGGILDNTVGYLYVINKDHLPEMSPDEIIMLREIGDGWYIYKTT